MKRILFFTLFVLCGFSALGQTRTLITDRAVVRDSIQLGGRWIYLVSHDSTFAAADHRSVATTKAIKDYVNSISGGGGLDDAYISGDTLYLVAPDSTYVLLLPQGADNWGTQVVEKDSTLRGNGTLADPLRVNRDTFPTRAEVAQALADSVAARPTGTGTTNALAKWLSSTSLGNSLLSDDGSRITAGGTAGFVLPVGTTAQRSGAPVAGETRVNSTNSNTMEWYTGTAWEVPLRAASVTGLGTSNRIGNYDGNGRLASSNAVVINGSLNNAELYSASSTRSGGGDNRGIVWGQNLSLTVSSGTYTTYLMGQYMTMSQGGQTNRSTFYFGGGTSTATYTALERTFGVGLESQVPTFSVNYGDGQTDATRRGFVVVGSNGNTDATGRDWGGTLSVTGIPEYSSTNYASTLNATVNPTTAVIMRNSENTAIAPRYHRFGLGTKMKVLGNEYLLTGRNVNNGQWNFTPALDSGLFQQITIVPHIQQWYKADKTQAAVIDNNGNLYVGSTIQFTPDKLTVAGTARVTGSSTLPAASVTGRDSLGVFRDVTIGSGLSFSEGTLSATGPAAKKAITLYSITQTRDSVDSTPVHVQLTNVPASQGSWTYTDSTVTLTSGIYKVSFCTETKLTPQGVTPVGLYQLAVYTGETPRAWLSMTTIFDDDVNARFHLSATGLLNIEGTQTLSLRQTVSGATIDAQAYHELISLTIQEL